MAKKLILAVAGAGKTYYISRSIDPLKKNLILSFTHENIKNIRNELIDRFSGSVPENTLIMTFHAFLYRMLIRPYEFTIFDRFKAPYSKTNGVTMKKPLKSYKFLSSNKKEYNKGYHRISSIKHYLDANNSYYCSLMAELLFRLKPKKKSEHNFLQDILESVSQFYDDIYIDEFQDFRNYDYKLLMELANIAENIVLVGDFYQHSVTGKDSTGIPFEKKNMSLEYSEFIDYMKSNGFDINTEMLKFSRRCSEEVCLFIRQKLGIPIEGMGNHGKIIFLDPGKRSDAQQIKDIMHNESIPKLVYNNAKNYPGCFINWSYSKGDTFEDVCVVLTDKTDKVCQDDWKCCLTDMVRNKFYVALTRAKHNVYLVSLKKLKDKQV